VGQVSVLSSGDLLLHVDLLPLDHISTVLTKYPMIIGCYVTVYHIDPLASTTSSDVEWCPRSGVVASNMQLSQEASNTDACCSELSEGQEPSN
jgi:hypothetical protein